MSDTGLSICVVGGGPRGTVVLERICANVEVMAPGAGVTVHVVDPYSPGAGRVWRHRQSDLLVMNTVACEVTVFTDPTVQCEGPIQPGPSLYEWARMVDSGEVAADKPTVTESSRMQPWSYATRAFQGRYLSWAFQHIAAAAPHQVTVRVHRATAVRVDDLADGRQSVHLDSDGPLVADAVVLAQGHYDVALLAAEQQLADFAAEYGAIYVPPASPAEVDLTAIRAGEPVIIRGLGLNFFDYMILLTAGRGGEFVRAGDRVAYKPSGDEPLLWVGSTRGVPYRARAEIHEAMVPRYRPRFLDSSVIGRFRSRPPGSVDFLGEVWPLVAKEAGWVHYRFLLRGDPDAAGREAFLAEYAECDWGTRRMERLIRRTFPNPADHWEWSSGKAHTISPTFADVRQHQEWVMDLLRTDAAASRLGPADNATKATAAMMRDLRAEIRQVISYHGLTGRSYREHIDHWFTGLANFLTSGPPASRVEELIALAEAGVVRFIGPRMSVSADRRSGRYVAWSAAVPAEPVTATSLIDAHLPLTDVRRATDPLIRGLLDTGRMRPHEIPDPGGTSYETGGIDVTEATLHIVDTRGVPCPGRFCYGPPIESVQWRNAIAARPHVNSQTLLQADDIARGALRAALQVASVS